MTSHERYTSQKKVHSGWQKQIKNSTLVALCEGNRPVTGGSPTKGHWCRKPFHLMTSSREQGAEIHPHMYSMYHAICTWFYSLLCLDFIHITIFSSFSSWNIFIVHGANMGPTWGSSGADRTQVGPMLAPHFHTRAGHNKTQTVCKLVWFTLHAGAVFYILARIYFSLHISIEYTHMHTPRHLSVLKCANLTTVGVNDICMPKN